MRKKLHKIANYLLNKQYVYRVVMRFLSEETKERILIAKLRGEFCFFGYDTTHMTDEEIKEGLKNMGKAMGSFGVTIEEAGRVSRVMIKI